MKDEELAVCPFCGEHAVMVRHPGNNWDGKMGDNVNIGALHGLWYVGCPQEFFEGLVKHCEISPSASWFADINLAIKAWNHREPIRVEFKRKKKS